jgi:hypothetical protein
MDTFFPQLTHDRFTLRATSKPISEDGVTFDFSVFEQVMAVST